MPQEIDRLNQPRWCSCLTGLGKKKWGQGLETWICGQEWLSLYSFKSCALMCIDTHKDHIFMHIYRHRQMGR